MPNLFERSWQSVVSGSVDANGRSTGYIRISTGGGEGAGLSDGGGGNVGFPALFTHYSVVLNEKVQVLETFNEFIHIYAFGRAVGRATLGGQVVASGGSLRGIQSSVIGPYEGTLRARVLADAGNLAIISGPGGVTMQGVVVSAGFSVSTEGGGNDNVASFSLEMYVTGGQDSSISATGVSFS